MTRIYGILPRTLIALLLGLVSAPAVLASDERVDRLPEKHRKWLEEEVVYIISAVEREAFLELESEREREAFTSAFWRRRDSNPNTPENEYREEHYRRLAYANEFLGRDTFHPGWRTDRGRYYIILGPPATREDFTYSDAVYPAELWFYNNPDLKSYGLPAFFYLLFFKRGAAGELELYDHVLDGPQALLTGYQAMRRDFRDGIEAAHERLYEVSPELAHAALSFLTDEGNVADDVTPFGSVALLEDIREAPLVGVDTSYAERVDFERGLVESDYLFSYVPSHGVVHVLPGPGAYYVHWAIEIDPQHVAVVRDPERKRYGSLFTASLEIVAAEDPNVVLLQQRTESFLDLTEEQAQRGLRSPYLFSGMTPVLPGRYTARVILRNRACPGRYDDEDCRKSYTMLETGLDVSEVQFERPALTELVLAHHVEPPADGLYRPYRFGSLAVTPNPSGVYAVGETLYALAEPLNAPGDALVRFRLYQHPAPGVSGAAPDLRLEETVSANQPRSGPLTRGLELEDLSGGRYELQVDLVDPQGSALASRSAELTITPRTGVARPVIQGLLSRTRPEIAGAVETLLGEQSLALARNDEARRFFERAVSRNPRLVVAVEELSALLLEDGEPARAVELLEPVYAEVQDRFGVLSRLGEAYYRTESYAKAVEVLEKAAALERPAASMLNMLAASHERTGNDERARELYERSLAEEPDQPAIRERLERLKSSP